MLIKIRDSYSPEIYFALYNPDPITPQAMLTQRFNLFLAGTPCSSRPRDLIFLDPPFSDSDIPPYSGWARIDSSTGILTQYLGDQSSVHNPLVNLYDFLDLVNSGQLSGNGTGWANRSKGIGPRVTWEVQP